MLTCATNSACEGGFIPAGLYTLTRWYKRSETSKRFGLYYIGTMFAGGTGGLMAYGMQVKTVPVIHLHLLIILG